MSERNGSGRVRVTVADGVADVRLSRPEKRNALDPAMFAGLITTGSPNQAEAVTAAFDKRPPVFAD